MAEKKIAYDDPSNWEYDGGPKEYTGEIASPYIRKITEDLIKQAFPEGREAYQREQAKKMGRG